ncbi:MAG TPA: hypothetical protein VMQ76_13150 [Terracidiphilus sp.]|nr:hypothetical protein [Terracidiphilus sp.]
MDKIRTLLKDGTVSFPKLECLDQVQSIDLETTGVAPTKPANDQNPQAA